MRWDGWNGCIGKMSGGAAARHALDRHVSERYASERNAARVSVLAGSIALLAAGCGAGGGAASGAAAARDSAGVRIVENAGPDRPAAWVAVEVAELVTPDSGLTAVPWGVAADASAGRIYVLDWRGERVAVFDRTGAYMGEYGRRGEGPGEFRNPAALSVDPSGVLTVWDAGRGVLSRWSAAGEPLGEEQAPVAYWGPGFHAGPGGVVTVTSRTEGMEQRQLLIEVAAGDSAVLHAVRRELVMMELPCVSQPAPRVFAPDVVWTARGGTVYVLNGPAYRIDAYAGGALKSSIRRAVAPVRVTERVALERVRFGQFAGLMRMCGVTAEQVLAAVGHEETTSPVQWLAVDPSGRLWVTRSSNGIIPEAVDVFDADGRYLGTMPAPGMPVAFPSPSAFVALTLRAATGETALKLYALRSDGG